MNEFGKIPRTLLIGIGNNGRSDDALGWLLADRMSGIDGMDIEYRYQLQIEDADLIAGYDTVIFADSTKEMLPEGYSFSQCLPDQVFTFSTHRLDPASVVWLCQDLFERTPEVYVLAMQGTAWELKQEIHPDALVNLEKAIAHLTTWLQMRSLTEQKKESLPIL